MRFTALMILVMLASFTGTAIASDAVAAADPSASELTKAIFDAVMHSQWWAAAAYGVVLAMIGARKVMPASWKEGVKGDVIGTATAFVIAFAGAIGTVVVAPGATMSLAVAAAAAKIAFVAIGGFTAVHKIAGWLAAWGKLPAWALPLVKLIALVVGSNAVAKAKTAGDKAVEAKPATGLASNDKVIEVE